MNFTPDTKSGTDTNTHAASSVRKNGRFAHNGQAGTYARNADVERKMNMENEKKYIEIRIEIDRDGVGVELHAKRVSAKDLAEGYVTAAKNIAEAIAQHSNVTVGKALGAMARDIFSLGKEAYEEEEED